VPLLNTYCCCTRFPIKPHRLRDHVFRWPLPSNNSDGLYSFVIICCRIKQSRFSQESHLRHHSIYEGATTRQTEHPHTDKTGGGAMAKVYHDELHRSSSMALEIPCHVDRPKSSGISRKAGAPGSRDISSQFPSTQRTGLMLQIKGPLPRHKSQSSTSTTRLRYPILLLFRISPSRFTLTIDSTLPTSFAFKTTKALLRPLLLSPAQILQRKFVPPVRSFQTKTQPMFGHQSLP
jgi:hypothetical protein